jgi:hypothetical protein
MSGYTTQNKNGDDCVLHYNGKLYYFKHAAEADESLVQSDLPDGYEVVLNSRTGWPFLKKTE